MNNHKIIINLEDSKKEIIFTTRNELKLIYIQKLLEKCHSSKQKNIIKCTCDSTKELYLSVKKKKRYFISKYPKGEEHKPTCIFHTFAQDLTEDTESHTAYSINIFKEPTKTNVKNDIKNSDDYEIAVRTTYYQYCNDLISFANSKAFYIANTQEKRNKNEFGINNFTFEDFCTAYYSALSAINIIKNGNVLDIQKNNKSFKFYYGVLTDSEALKEAVIKAKKLNSKDTIEIPTKIISYDFVKKCQIFKEQKLLVTAKRLLIALKLVQNEDGQTIKDTPYFFAASIDKDITIRLHLHLITFDEKRICFVDSSFERKYAIECYKNENKYAMIKPLSNNEIDDILPPLIGLPYILQKIPHIDYKPDFLLFDGNTIEIVEVSGYSNRLDYIEHLEKKIRYYQKLCDNYSFFKYTIYDGKTQKVSKKKRSDTLG